jgi:glycerol-3-phosphate acyltransferase PlsY
VALSLAPAFGSTFYFQSFACLLAAITFFKHRENIRRLLSATENRLRF